MILAILATEIDCNEYCDYHVGKSPKEHEDIRRLQSKEALYEQRHQELRGDENERHTDSMRVARAALVISVLSFLVSLATAIWAYYENGENVP